MVTKIKLDRRTKISFLIKLKVILFLEVKHAMLNVIVIIGNIGVQGVITSFQEM